MPAGYLAKVSKDWDSKVGKGKSVKWSVGQGMPGNQGVTGRVKDSPGAIGYVDLADAMQNKLAMASLKNPSGRYVKPEISAISAAAAGVEMPDMLYTSIIDAPGDAAYLRRPMAVTAGGGNGGTRGLAGRSLRAADDRT